MQNHYREAFLEELEEIVQTMDDEILFLEQNPNSTDHMNALFRAAHTLKGSSGAMGYIEMEQLTHEMEQILDEVRNERLSVSEQLIDLLLKTIDMIKQMREEILEHDEITLDTTGAIHEIRSFLQNPEEEKRTIENQSEPLKISESIQLRMMDALDHGMHIYQIIVTIDPTCELKAARASVVLSQLASMGDILFDNSPSFHEDDQSDDSLFETLTILFSTEHSIQECEDHLLALMDVKQVQIIPYQNDEVDEQIEPKNESQEREVHEQVQEVQEKTMKRVDAPTVSEKSKMQTIRVNVERLDHLMNLVGELIIDQTRIRRLEHELMQHIPGHSTVKELDEVSDHIGRTIADLQDSVMKVRMLPIEQLFNRFPRMVRDLAQKLNKEIDFVMEGKETELDRTLIEEIGDPLIHLIRNAIDHGIEEESIRIQRGKPKKGSVRLSATHEDNHIMISVSDDGGGIHPEYIKQSALKKGIITEEEATSFSELEAVHLVFHPGFTTASVVSDVSGRGVGMDIVRSQIEKLNGVIEVQTELGIGTTFKIKLPLTLAIITGLLVGANHDNRVFVLPLSNVLEIVRIKKEELRTINGKEVIHIREQIIPVVWLHHIFNFPSTPSSSAKIPIVILGLGEKRMALAVDQLIGNQDIVIKSLGSYLGNIEGVLGATILGDGKVAMILDMAGLMKNVQRI